MATMTAAVTAAEAGKSVVMLEKMDIYGGNTNAGEGTLNAPDPERQEPMGIEDSPDFYYTQTFEGGDSAGDPALVRILADNALDAVHWMEDHGLVYEKEVFTAIGGLWQRGHAVEVERKGEQGGSYYVSCLMDAAQATGNFTLYTDAKIEELIVEGGAVVGVRGTRPSSGEAVEVRGKSVVLATGGFEFDQESLMNFTMGTGIGALGNPGNTGDGLRLAQSVGAKLWHMNAYSAGLDVRYPGYSTNVGASIKGAGYIWVDQDGRRFANELTDGHCQMYAASVIDAVNHRYPRIPCWLVFDHATLRMGPLGSSLGSGWAINREHHTWSKDCEKEIEMGLVKKADTIADLARAIKVPVEELEATVKRWNEDIRAGKDTLFGRPVKKAAKSYAFDAPLVSAPIEKGPYYALELWPTLVNTQGGPRRDEKARIVSALGKTIPRLYGAGELGSMWGPIYQGSCNNAEALVFGRIAGRNAADEKPWC